MTREEFSQWLVSVRNNSNVTIADLFRMTGIDTSTIYKIEKAKSKYNIELIIQYLSVLGLRFVLRKGTQFYNMDSSEDFAQLLSREREEKKLSLVEIADAIGSNGNTISFIIRGKYRVNIDLLLKLTEYFGYTIVFQPTNTTT